MPLSDFECAQCGNCCRQSGYVHLIGNEPDMIAAFLGLDTRAFIAQYARLTFERDGLSLTEKPDGSCILLQADFKCSVNQVKPAQCRDFPTRWRYEGWEKVCPAHGGIESDGTAVQENE